MDVGGGSTEVSFISQKELISSVSYNVGTLRMLSGTVGAEVLEQMAHDLTNLTQGYQDIVLIGSGGNINKLYRLASKHDKRKERLPVSTPPWRNCIARSVQADTILVPTFGLADAIIHDLAQEMMQE